ncbi:MAG: LLM class F420-dependent oxidoreductase [Rhodospirillaceae bacterium]|jgi:probable F420-dependent oxidoreductase|nr:LLM class F420-dependent oxidoreductase [Rhodospirillaceae bacterium]MBT3495232.1 LLM class F420-dependent oxidoreductase [Rhodospirillaceae bacterium]MBT3780298.1 LLM class F420-dependent oxidoreductase [Rhodospirillaceae bacterium]MBT3977356.1 LLM class F420-dependent oxidoreductase [Rhodospirillaceae bacterium]MBT4168161.1 LLM class F420-dependent oxidoreductase [Rhodospirillaceae bacterium]
MDYGVAIFPTDYSITPAELAVAAEERGFESLWFPEHSHIPLSRLSPWGGGGELPKHYYDCMDPLIAMATAAAASKTIRLCTGVCLVIQRDPIQLAKEVATLDQLSNGRVILGVGAGWNAEEMADHGTAFDSRFRLMAERIAALKVIWTESKPEFSGEFVNFGPMMTWPKPIQKPHPPIILGGGFPHAARRAIEYGDGWMPLGGRGWDPLETLPRFRQMAAEAEREPDSLEITIFGADFEADSLKTSRDAGVHRSVITLPSAGRDEILPLLDRHAALIT